MKITKITGYFLLILSCLLWGFIIVIPFLKLETEWIAGLITALIIAGEVSFYISIVLLGKELWQKIKKWFMFWKRRGNEKQV